MVQKSEKTHIQEILLQQRTFSTSTCWREAAVISEHSLFSNSASLMWNAALMCWMAVKSSGHLPLVSNCKITTREMTLDSSTYLPKWPDSTEYNEQVNEKVT